MRSRDDVPTPALLLDLDRFEANVARMTAHLRERGKAFRPHGKTHKCPEVARRFVAAGAVGSCTARLSEAEVFAEHGLRGLLVTTAVIGAAEDRARGRARPPGARHHLRRRNRAERAGAVGRGDRAPAWTSTWPSTCTSAAPA